MTNKMEREKSSGPMGRFMKGNSWTVKRRERGYLDGKKERFMKVKLIIIILGEFKDNLI